jgi:hypothetical protein
MRIFLVLSVLIIVTLFGCENFVLEDPIEKDPKITFQGIVERDARGMPYTEDPDDWKLTDTWVEQELKLFGISLNTNCKLPESYGIIAYPNPLIDQFVLHVNKPDSVRMAIRIVDKNFKTLMSIDSMFATMTKIDVSDFGMADTVRVYYKFLDGSCEFRGHGDLVIKK